MDRGHGATYAGSDSYLLEYWEEYQKMIDETKMLDDYLDEECSPRSYDGMYCCKITTYNLKIIVKRIIFEKLKHAYKNFLNQKSC